MFGLSLMRPRVILTVTFVVFISFGMALRLPYAISKPSESLGMALVSMGFVWGPLRDARIRTSLYFGATPDDVVGGETVFTRALAFRDERWTAAFLPMISEATMLDAIAYVCEASDIERLESMIRESYSERFGDPVPGCESEAVLEPAPWRSPRSRSRSSGDAGSSDQ